MKPIVVIFVGLLVLAAFATGGYVIYVQDSQIDDLESSVRELQLSAADRADESRVAERYDAATLPAEDAALLAILMDVLQVQQQAVTSSYVSVRLDEIEGQLGFDAPFWPADSLEERLTEVEWNMNAICSNLHLNGVTVLC